MAIVKGRSRIPRYADVVDKKAQGATYTPKVLADFVARKITDAFTEFPVNRPLRILDPAVGDGQLLISLLELFSQGTKPSIEVYGFETDKEAFHLAQSRLTEKFPAVSVYLQRADFLEFVSENFGTDGQGLLFAPEGSESFELDYCQSPLRKNTNHGVSSGTAHQSEIWTFRTRRPLPCIHSCYDPGPKARGLRGYHSFKPFHVHSFRCARSSCVNGTM